MANPDKKFATTRTRTLLSGELNKFERTMVSAIEQYGCHVISVKSDVAGLGWAYTQGVFDTCGQPELIVVGLPAKTGHSALNDAAALLRAGNDLTVGRHRELVGEVEVVFRHVAPSWVRELMGSAKWFNESWDFPVLQMIYPDLENKFQWEAGFTEYFRQPLLQADAEMTVVEKDFRSSLNPQSSLYDWKFPDPPHTSSYSSKTVHQAEEAVTYVSHDADGDWQFLGDLMSDGGGPVVVCLHHPIDNDASLKELWDLPLGWVAERTASGEPWVRREHKLEQNSSPSV